MIPAETRKRERVTRLALSLLTVAVIVGGVGWNTWVSLRPSVADAIALAEAGRFDEAEAKAKACLSAYHANDAIELLIAQIVLKRAGTPSSQNQDRSSKAAIVALDHLSRVRPDNPRMAIAFHVSRGNAFERLQRLDEAEQAWLDALQISPAVPEASSGLFNLYYLLGRDEDVRRLAHRLLPDQADPQDRVMVLLELARRDVRPPAPESLAPIFEQVVLKNPADLQATLALGSALTRSGRIDEGIDCLRRVIQNHPDRVEARDYLLTALDDSGRIDQMEEELERLPAAMSASPRFLKHRARIAQGRRWQEAVALYRQARAAEPQNRTVEYRLSRALRNVGATTEADQIAQQIRNEGIGDSGTPSALRPGHRDHRFGYSSESRALPETR